MCLVRLSVATKLVRAGGNEVINVDGGWPGATAAVSVTYSGSSPATASGKVRLNWEGSGRVRISVPRQAAHLSCSQVRIQAVLSLGSRFKDKRGPGLCFSVAA
jgi:hypothetical protein